MKIVFYDLEMICWENKSGVGEIIEIGAVMVDLKTQQIVSKTNVIVKPSEAINPFTTKITGITQKMVDKQGVPLTEAIRRINKKISLKHPWFAWGRDSTTIDREFSNHGIKHDISNFHNLATFVRTLHGENRSLGLKECCELYGAEIVKPLHRALPDAVTLANLGLRIFGHYNLSLNRFAQLSHLYSLQSSSKNATDQQQDSLIHDALSEDIAECIQKIEKLNERLLNVMDMDEKLKALLCGNQNSVGGDENR